MCICKHNLWNGKEPERTLGFPLSTPRGTYWETKTYTIYTQANESHNGSQYQPKREIGFQYAVDSVTDTL